MDRGRVVAMTIRLWLVRHGSTEWSEAGRYTGSTDLPLSERGRAEAQALTWLAERTWAGVWTSDLERALETARLAGLEATLDRRLREIDFGSLEGATWGELPDPVQHALLDFDDFVAPEGESTAQLSARVEDFIDGLPDGDHLIFTHGGVARLLLRAEGGDTRFLPGAVAILEIDAARRKRLDLPAVDNGD